MSSNDSVFILKSIADVDGEYEYRVKHLSLPQVENAESLEDDGIFNKEQCDTFVCKNFETCEVFDEYDLAVKEANKIYRKNRYIEYGLTVIDMNRKFPTKEEFSSFEKMYKEKAKEYPWM